MPIQEKTTTGAFFFFIFKKIKISKIYVCFEKFQKYTPVALWGQQALNVIFFLQICNEVPGWGRVRASGACRPPRATGGARPQTRQGGLSSPRGRQGGPVAPPWATGSCPPI